MELTKKEKSSLERKHILSNEHLRRWYPIRYIDNTKETGLLNGEHSCIVGNVLSAEVCQMKQKNINYMKMKLVERTTGTRVLVMIFGGKYFLRKYEYMVGADVFVSGKAKYDAKYGWSISSPEVCENFTENLFRIIPVYSSIGGLKEERIRELIQNALLEKEEETVPKWMLERYHLLDINESLESIMNPCYMTQVKEGYLRSLFDDLLYMAGQFVLTERHQRNSGIPYVKTTDLMEQIIQKFPYHLTKGQSDTVDRIVKKMKTGDPIRTLVQGDVGCGKTITGFLPMIAAAENGVQACMVAPTKNLAKQHFQKLSELLEGTDISVDLFCGDTVKKSKLTDLASGKIRIAVGTHTLISDKVVFQNLGVIVIDEEHKFGVAQRQKLMEKAEEVDTISMSATPIPRTMARALYGSDTEVFSIKEVPGGRKVIQTYYDDGSARQKWVDYVTQSGQQVYVICPAIEECESEKMAGVMSVQEAYKKYKSMFPDKKIATFDGKMKPAEADRLLEEYRTGKIDILIATTVIEVGLDVPNATLIIIENAERFGLSQLHQLRGRVGRGDKQSFCILISKDQNNMRIQTLCKISDGFEIARIDLEELRKSGTLFGEEQSGFNIYVEEMMSYPGAYENILMDARTLSDEVIQNHIQKVTHSEVIGKRKKVKFLQ